jgi:amino acid transporter
LHVHAGVVGFIYLLAITFSIQDPSTLLDPSNATGGTFVVGQVVLDAFMARGGDETFARASAAALLCIPLVAQLFCSMSSVTGNSRTLWSFARDKAVPGHRCALAHNSKATGVL